MSEWQEENGAYTRISNELIEALARFPSLGGEGSQLLWFVFRYTYGFQRKKAELSISFIAKGTMMKRSSVCRAINRLVSKRLLARSKSSITFNKNYDEWVATKRLPQSPNGIPPSSQTETNGSLQTANKVVSVWLPKKEIKKTHKENNDKEILAPNGAEDKDIVEVLNAFKTTNLNPMINFGNITERKACGELLKAYGLEKVLRMIEFVATLIDKPYAPTITTPYQLKNKLGALIAYSKKNEAKNNLVANI